jgi:hypothetical protein
MAFRLLRAWCLRIAVMAAGLALPLFAAGAAQAAIAGAPPANSVDRPNLLSATVTQGDIRIDPVTVEYCFDRTVSSTVPTPLDFRINGYLAGNEKLAFSAARDAQNSKCVDANYHPATVGDLNQYTIGSAYASGVTDASSGNANRDDSTALTGSTTHNGTQGLTAAPNLTGIANPGSNNVLAFIFDKATQEDSPGDVYIVNAAGIYCQGAFAGYPSPDNFQHTVLLYVFSTGCMNVNNAVEGIAYPTAVDAQSDPSAVNYLETKLVSGGPTNSFANNPSVVSATLDSSNQDAIDYTFDRPVHLETAGDFCFTGSLGDAQSYCASSGNVVPTSTTVLQATFGGALKREREYAVQASVFNCGVEDNTSNNNCNIEGQSAIGANANAFARGFTSGPDVFAVTLNSSNDTATVNVDQTLCQVANGCPNEGTPVVAANILAYLNHGTAGGTSASSFQVINPTQNFGPQQVKVFWNPGGLTGATMLQFLDCSALEGTTIASANSTCDEANAMQIVAPIGSGSIARAVRVAKAHHRFHASSHRRHVKHSHKR